MDYEENLRTEMQKRKDTCIYNVLNGNIDYEYKMDPYTRNIVRMFIAANKEGYPPKFFVQLINYAIKISKKGK
jgi:hypothetical protein